MKQILFSFLAVFALSLSSQTTIASLGSIHNKLVERNLELKAYFNNEELSRIEIECPTSGYTVGTICVKAEDLPQFREIMGKIRPGMAMLVEKVEANGYGEVSTGFDNIPIKVTYKWDGIRQESDGDLEIFLAHDAKGKYTSGIRHKAFDDSDDNFVSPFFLQFKSLYEVDYMLLLLSDDNIKLSSKKDDLLIKIYNDTH